MKSTPWPTSKSALLALGLALLAGTAQTQGYRPQISAPTPPAAPAETAEQKQKRLDDAKALKDQTDQAAKNRAEANSALHKAAEEERRRKNAEAALEKQKRDKEAADELVRQANERARKAEGDAANAKAQLLQTNAAAEAAATAATQAHAAARADWRAPGERHYAFSGGPIMVVLPSTIVAKTGTLLGQASGSGDDEKPPYQVRVPYPLAMGESEVSKGEFAAFIQATGYVTEAQKAGSMGCYNHTKENDQWAWREIAGKHWDDPGFPGFTQPADYPVVCISWRDAQAYVNWVNQKAGEPTGSKTAYRLPTEAEWEYAARAGSDTLYPWGGANDTAKQCSFANGADQTKSPDGTFWSDNKAKCEDGHWYTAGKGKFQANAFGLYHMHGNVWEWVQDCYASEEYQRREKASGGWDARQTAPEVNDCRRVLRGGGWYGDSGFLRSANRVHGPPGNRNSGVGFRLARTLP